MQRMLYGLGYSQTNGKCWLPPVGDAPGRWTDADPLAECTYAPPGVIVPPAPVVRPGFWARLNADVPLWMKVAGAFALAAGGYVYYRRRK